LSRCPPRLSKLYGRVTPRKAFDSTRARRAQAGSGSAWMWDGRSTSCIPGRCPARLPRHPERGGLPPRVFRGVQAVANTPQDLAGRRLPPEPARDIVAGDTRLHGETPLEVERLPVVRAVADEVDERQVGRALLHVGVL